MSELNFFIRVLILKNNYLLKYIHAALILVLLIPNYSNAAKKCKQGFSSFWEFDQKKESITLKEIFPLKVCNYTKKQLYANFRFILKKGKKEVFSNEIFWSEENIYEKSDKDGNISGIKEKGMDYKIIKFPIPSRNVDSYEVVKITSKKKIGEGVVKLKK